MAVTWERLSTEQIGRSFELYRAKAPGGWLVSWKEWQVSAGAGGLTFYPDPQHQWTGNSLP